MTAGPAIRIERGNPDETELAAVMAVMLAAMRNAPEPGIEAPAETAWATVHRLRARNPWRGSAAARAGYTLHRAG